MEDSGSKGGSLTKVTEGGESELSYALSEQEVRVGLGLLDLAKTLAYMDAVELTQLRITKKEDGWLVMLKGTFRGRKKVAWVHTRRFEDAVTILATSADCGYLVWQEDNPPWERK